MFVRLVELDCDALSHTRTHVLHRIDDVFHRYPSLFDICKSHLVHHQSAENLRESRQEMGSVSPAYAVMLLLSRLSPYDSGADSMTASEDPTAKDTTTASVERDWGSVLQAIVDFGMCDSA